MRIRVIGWCFAVAAALFAAPGQAQNVSSGAPIPFAQTGVPLPFTFNSPLAPATTPTVPGFAESPVGPYGRPTTPITTPAAPIIAVRPTPLIPNGVLRSNGAIVAPGDSFATVIPAQSIPILGVADLASPFSTRPTIGARAGNSNGRNSRQGRGSVNGAQAGPGRNTRRDSTNAEDRNQLPLTGPPANSVNGAANNEADTTTNVGAANLRDRLRDARPSVESLIERLGAPTSVIYQDDGQVLFFNGGVRVFVRDGIVQ